MRRTLLIVLLISLSLGGCRLGGSEDYYAWNYPQAIDVGGLVVQVGRVLLAPEGTFKEDFFKAPYFQDKPVVGELIFVVQNKSGQTWSVYPGQALVAIGGEQVDLFEAGLNGRIGESVDGEILAGITKIGGFWFGLHRTPLDQIKSMSIIISGPFDVNNNQGAEYHFNLDLSDRKSEPMPDELK